MSTKEDLEYIRDVRKVDGMKFRNVQELTRLIDLHNQTIEKKNGIDYDVLIHDITIHHIDRSEKNSIFIK